MTDDHFFAAGSFPATRLRRLRSQEWLRRMVAETTLAPSDLILPVFLQEGSRERTAIDSLPGIERLSIDLATKLAREARDAGIPAIALFPVIDPSLKNAEGSEALNAANLICRAITSIKKAVADLGIITDVALDPYTSHGHDGVLGKSGDVDNDATVAILCQQAVLQAQAGADIIAPSDMMDGRVGAIRAALDKAGFQHVAVLAYSAKYASALYGPFREAVGSKNNLGKADKRTYQMNPANATEALREMALDIAEGADMLMVKPGTLYLDIIHSAKEHFAAPVLAYHVSGEYAMAKAAGEKGWVDADAVIMESLLSLKRAGASAILTYAALDVARRLKAGT